MGYPSASMIAHASVSRLSWVLEPKTLTHAFMSDADPVLAALSESTLSRTSTLIMRELVDSWAW